MAHLRITVDGVTAMDGDTGEWTTNPPELVAQALKEGTRAKVWMQMLMLVVVHAATAGTDTAVEVTTHGNDWEMAVSES